MAHDHRLILASRVEHTPVFNEDGWLIGHIRDLSIDRETGQVAYAIMSFGGFLGLGNRLHPLPWSILGYDPERQGYVVPLDRAELAKAPHYDADELEEYGGAHRTAVYTDVLAFYGRYGPPPI